MTLMTMSIATEGDHGQEGTSQIKIVPVPRTSWVL